MTKRIIGMVFLGLGCGICQAAAGAEPQKIVTAFFTTAFVDRQPREAAMRYISPDKYIQHNPNGKDGRESFINGFAKYVESTSYRCEIKRVIAERDLVAVHSHCKEKPDDRGNAVVDIFRVENDLIVEHWDVMQAVPESPKNANTMF
jgi:predicted SnoaL-like aldol condensation-catalyzing enzyme